MARFRCRGCGAEESLVYDGRRDCPRCGSVDVQFALSIEELDDDHPLIAALIALAESEPPPETDD
jgi:hypothetical protein